MVALGGDALIRRDEHEVVVTHGNGPQLGLLALQAETYRDVAPRVACLLATAATATAAVGTVAGGALDPGGFRTALAVVAGLLAVGGAIGVYGIRNPRRDVEASGCAAGQLAREPSAIAA